MSDDVLDKKQKLLIEFMIADRDVLVKCIKIIKPSYFEAPLDRVVETIVEYFNKYHSTPSVDIIDAETGIKLKEQSIDKSEIEYLLEEIEQHCQDAAMTEAILLSVDLLKEDKKHQIPDLVRKALMVQLDNSVGLDLFEDPETRIINTDADSDNRPIGIPELDKLIGDIRRGELGMFFAETSGGKSVMLANAAVLLAEQKLDVAIISLELSDVLYSKRLDSILTETDIAFHKQKATDIADILKNKKDSYGKIITKRMPANRTTVSHIRSYLMEYHLLYGKYPDVLVVDYLKLLGVDNYTRNMGTFEMDESKAIDLRELAAEFSMYVLSAGQLNRDGYGVTDIGPQHIAGGISVANTIDWGIAMYATEEDIDNNQVQLRQLKMRSNAKTKKPITLYRCPRTLRFSDTPFSAQISNSLATPKTKVPQKQVPPPPRIIDEDPVISNSKNKLRELIKGRKK